MTAIAAKLPMKITFLNKSSNAFTVLSSSKCNVEFCGKKSKRLSASVDILMHDIRLSCLGRNVVEGKRGSGERADANPGPWSFMVPFLLNQFSIRAPRPEPRAPSPKVLWSPSPLIPILDLRSAICDPRSAILCTPLSINKMHLAP